MAAFVSLQYLRVLLARASLQCLHHLPSQPVHRLSEAASSDVVGDYEVEKRQLLRREEHLLLLTRLADMVLSHLVRHAQLQPLRSKRLGHCALVLLAESPDLLQLLLPS